MIRSHAALMSKVAGAAAVLLLVTSAFAQPADKQKAINPPANLVAKGIPPVPASLPHQVRRYTEFRTASLADWHPQRREMLIVTRFGNTPQIHRVAMPMGARTQLTFFDEPVTTATYQPATGEFFVFSKDTGGNEFTQLYRFDKDSTATLLSDGGRSQNGGIEWSRGGRRMAYTSTRRNGADRDIYVMDPAQPKSDRMVMQVSGGGWGVEDWSPDDKQLVVREVVSVNESYLWLVDVEAGTKSAITPRTEGGDAVAHRLAKFSRDGSGLYLTTDKGSEFQRLGYMDLATRELTPLTAQIEWDVVALDLSEDGQRLAFVTNEAGVSKLYVLDTATRKYQQAQGLPVGVVRALKWHTNGKDLGFSLSSARSMSDAYSIEVQSGKITRWTESELGGLPADELPQAELIRWKSFDGREISGFYYAPPPKFTGKRPVMISIHGGPEGQSRPTLLGRNNYYLNELGVAMIFPNVRGSTGYGKTFVKLDNGTKRLDSVKDIGALLDWIATRPDLDADRVMVMGGSYGGYMTLATAVQHNARIRCALAVVGISNFNTFLKNTESYRRDLRRVEYGDERLPEMREFFERTAPLNNASKITRPLFVVQGANDPRVPASEAQQMVDTVRKNGTPVWYLLGKDEGHGFRKKQNADFQFYAAVMFVKTYLIN